MIAKTWGVRKKQRGLSLCHVFSKGERAALKNIFAFCDALLPNSYGTANILHKIYLFLRSF